nr:hypothetical protein [Chloroflexia bacterium]
MLRPKSGMPYGLIAEPGALRIVDGSIEVPDRPGMGVEFNSIMWSRSTTAPAHRRPGRDTVGRGHHRAIMCWRDRKVTWKDTLMDQDQFRQMLDTRLTRRSALQTAGAVGAAGILVTQALPAAGAQGAAD